MVRIPDDRLGFTLIELIVALALSSIVAAAAMSFFVKTNSSFQNEEQVDAVQQNGRVAIEYLARSIQNAGYNVVRGRRFLAASDRYITTVFDENGDGVIQNTEVITYCLSKRGESPTESLQIYTYFDRDEDGEVEANEGGTCTIPLSLSGPVYNLYQAIPNLTDEGSAKAEIASSIENLVIRYYDQDNKPLPLTREDPDDPNSPRIAPTPPYSFASVPLELNNIRRIEMECMVRSDKPVSGQSNTGTYPDKTVATYSQSGTPRADISYQEGYYHYTFRINVSPRNLIEAPWGRVRLEADPNAVPCSGTTSVIRATLVDGNGDSLVNQQVRFCVNYDDEDGTPDAFMDPNLPNTDANGVATSTLTYDWSNGPKTFTVSASSVIDIDPGPMKNNKTLYNAIGVAFYGLTIISDPNNLPPYSAGDTATFQVTGGTEPYTWSISLAPPNPLSWVLSTPVGSINSATGFYQATATGTILVCATDSTGCTENKLICPEIVLSYSPMINFNSGQTTTFSATQGTPPYRWMTTSPSIGVIDPNSGAYTQVGNGTTMVMAVDYNGCVGQIQTCPQIAIAPSDPNLALGDSVTFSASGGASPYSWLSSDSSVGTIHSSTGLFTMTGYGHTTITAIDTHGCQGQITIDTCIPIAIVPNSPRYQVGEFPAPTFWTSDGTPPYRWTSSSPGVGGIDGDGHFNAGGRGQTVITVTDDHGCEGQTTVIVCSELTITPSTSGYHAGHTVALSAGGGESPYSWATSDPNVATIAADGNLHTVSPGTVRITATDSYGCQSGIDITITEASHDPLFYDSLLSAANWNISAGWSLPTGYLKGRSTGSTIASIKDSVWNPDWVDYIVVVKLKENPHSSGYDDIDGAILARYQDDTHSYKLEMDTDTSGLHLDRWNGGENTLSTISFSYQVDEWYYQKMKVEGNTISAKVWKDGDPEPSNWMITCTDSTFATGKVALRVNSADVLFDSITIYDIDYE